MHDPQPSLDAGEMLAFHFDTTDSTNARAADLARAHPGRLLVVAADEQTAGQGRAGRPWCSPRGGAWFSVAVPMLEDVARYRPAPLAAGLAVIDVLAEVLSGDAVAELEIKWPNDVLLNGAKVCGILCKQMLPTAGSVNLPATLIVGVGINVNLSCAELPSNVRYPAISVQAVAGRPMPVGSIIQQCARAIQVELAMLEPTGLCDTQHRRLQAALAWRGQTVTVGQASAATSVTGTLRSIDAQGRVLVNVDGQSTPQPFAIGDLHLRRRHD